MKQRQLRQAISLPKLKNRRLRKRRRDSQTFRQSLKPILTHPSRKIPYQHSSASLKRKIKQPRLLQRVRQLQQREPIQATNGKKSRLKKLQNRTNVMQMSTKLRHSRARRPKSNLRMQCQNQRVSSKLSLRSLRNQKEVPFQTVHSSCQCQRITNHPNPSRQKHSQRLQSQSLRRKKRHL